VVEVEPAQVAVASPVSQEKCRAAWLPSAVNCRANARKVVVLPVCRGAWTTKYIPRSTNGRACGRRGSGGNM
jgi:hypothetical protein